MSSSWMPLSPTLLLACLMFFAGVSSFCLKWYRLLLALLSLELLTLSIFIAVVITQATDIDSFFSMFFLSVGACEGAMGLTILVSSSRKKGGEIMTPLSTLPC